MDSSISEEEKIYHLQSWLQKTLILYWYVIRQIKFHIFESDDARSYCLWIMRLYVFEISKKVFGMSDTYQFSKKLQGFWISLWPLYNPTYDMFSTDACIRYLRYWCRVLWWSMVLLDKIHKDIDMISYGTMCKGVWHTSFWVSCDKDNIYNIII